MQPSTIAFLAGTLPALAVAGSYILSASLGYVDWCVPHFQGCSSISMAARQHEVVHFFRGIILPSAAIKAAFWVYAYHWLVLLGDTNSVRPKTMAIIGFIGALFLILYGVFIGTEGEMYKFMRRTGNVVYFALTGFAQLLLVSRLYTIKIPEFLIKYRKTIFVTGTFLLALALVQLATDLILEDNYHVQNIVEWFFATAMSLIFIVFWAAWKETGYRSIYRLDTTRSEY